MLAVAASVAVLVVAVSGCWHWWYVLLVDVVIVDLHTNLIVSYLTSFFHSLISI